MQGNVFYYSEGRHLKLADLTNPAAPSALGALALPTEIRSIAVSGSYAYVSDVDTLFVVDVLDPAHPAVLGSTPAIAFDIVVDGTRAFVAAGAGGLLVFDVSNPAAPSRIGRLDTPGYAVGVAVPAA